MCLAAAEIYNNKAIFATNAGAEEEGRPAASSLVGQQVSGERFSPRPGARARGVADLRMQKRGGSHPWPHTAASITWRRYAKSNGFVR